MKRSVLLLTLSALLVAPFASAAFAGETSAAIMTGATQSTQVPLVLEPTQGALSTAYMGCAEENLVLESFFQQPEQSCIDYCTNNGWTYLSYDDVGRGLYICICCSA